MLWEQLLQAASTAKVSKFKTYASIEQFINKHDLPTKFQMFILGSSSQDTKITKRMYSQFFTICGFPDTLLAHACVCSVLASFIDYDVIRTVLRTKLHGIHVYDLLVDKVSYFVSIMLGISYWDMQAMILKENGIDASAPQVNDTLLEFFKKGWFISAFTANVCCEQVFLTIRKTTFNNLTPEQCLLEFEAIGNLFGRRKYERYMKFKISEESKKYQKELELNTFLLNNLKDILLHLSTHTLSQMAARLIHEADEFRLGFDDRCMVIQFILDTRTNQDKVRFDSFYFHRTVPSLTTDLRRQFANELLDKGFGVNCTHFKIHNGQIDETKVSYTDHKTLNKINRQVSMDCDSTTFSRQSNQRWRVPHIGSTTPTGDSVYLSLTPYCDQCKVGYKVLCDKLTTSDDIKKCITNRKKHTALCVTPDQGDEGHIMQVTSLERRLAKLK